MQVQPHAARDEVLGWEGEVLWLRVRAPALEGKANAAVEALLAEALGLPKRAVMVVRGHRSRGKTVEVTTDPEEAVRRRLAAFPTRG